MSTRFRPALAGGTMALLFSATLSGQALACSRILWNDNGQATVVARTMDLDKPDKAKMVDTTTSDGMNEKGLVANLLYLAIRIREAGWPAGIVQSSMGAICAR